MIKKLKEYSEYRKNKKLAKRELTRMAAIVLPSIINFAEKKADTLNFIQNLVTGTKSLSGEELVRMVLDVIADKLVTDQTRIAEILQYMANMNPDDIQSVLLHSVAGTMPDNTKAK